MQAIALLRHRIDGDHLLDPDYDDKPTVLCRKLSRGEMMPRKANGATIADRTANPKAIA